MAQNDVYLQVTNLDENAERVAEEHPEEAEAVQKQLAEINTAWDDLKQMVRVLCIFSVIHIDIFT